MSHHDTIIHLLAGGIGGTAGAIATCPLEVVKTRLQSSVASFHSICVPPTVGSSVKTQPIARFSTCATCNTTVTTTMTFAGGSTSTSLGLFKCIKHIVETEGARALFKGLGPNLVGVAPSRAIYFWSYSSAKNFFNVRLNPETPLVHICSAAFAGFTACTVTNPIWFVKTRLQLDQRKDNRLTTLQCIKQIYRTDGLIGFYKGVTASYFGISETVIHFVVYEAIKSKLLESRGNSVTDVKTTRDFVEFMFAGAISKTCASILAYPHEVARTRLRQEGDKYRTFWQTIATVFREEGHRGLYRGLVTQLVRQIPNTAIMMATYEAVVYLFTENNLEDSLDCQDGDDY